MKNAVLEPHAIEELQSAWAKAIGMPNKDLGFAFVNDTCIDSTTGHPVRGHETGWSRSDDEPGDDETGLINQFGNLTHRPCSQHGCLRSLWEIFQGCILWASGISMSTAWIKEQLRILPGRFYIVSLMLCYHAKLRKVGFNIGI